MDNAGPVVSIALTLVNLILIVGLSIGLYLAIRDNKKLKKEIHEELPIELEQTTPDYGDTLIYKDTHDNKVYANIYDQVIEYVLVSNTGQVVGTITMHNGPMSGGLRGFFNEHVLASVKHRIGMLNEKVPCSQNRLALKLIEESLQYLEARTKLRAPASKD